MRNYGLCLVAGIFSFLSHNAYAAQASHFIGLHGLAEANENTEKVTSIFSTLASVSDRDIFGVDLVIVSDNKPWARALEDGNVVMSDAVIDLIYKLPDQRHADAWMAFLLGHELAHISNADHWHRSQQRRRVASSDPALDTVYEGLFENELNINQIRNKELKADLDGFFYATLAGYDTSLLFVPISDGKTLLELWPAVTGDDETHQSGSVRMKFLAEEFDRLQEDIAFFDNGLKLAHFGRFEDALHMFRKFQSKYPSIAVTNNLAYIYIQLARQNMPSHLAYRYWFPTLLEANSGLPTYAIPRTYGDTLPPKAIAYLNEAVYLLTSSPRLKKGLPEYLNLIVAHWYLGETAKARAIIVEALNQFPDNGQLMGLQALVLLREGTPEADTWGKSKSLLKALIAGGNTDINIRFNLARLLSDRKRHGDAKRHWAYLVAHADRVASPYLAIACDKLNGDRNCIDKRIQPPIVQTLIRIGSDIGELRNKKLLANWAHTSTEIKGEKVDLFQHDSGDSLLALDNLVEIYTTTTPPWRTRSQLVTAVGLPDNITPVSQGLLFSYADALSALVQGETVIELWVSRPMVTDK